MSITDRGSHCRRQVGEKGCAAEGLVRMAGHAPGCAVNSRATVIMRDGVLLR